MSKMYRIFKSFPSNRSRQLISFNFMHTQKNLIITKKNQFTYLVNIIYQLFPPFFMQYVSKIVRAEIANMLYRKRTINNTQQSLENETTLNVI